MSNVKSGIGSTVKRDDHPLWYIRNGPVRVLVGFIIAFLCVQNAAANSADHFYVANPGNIVVYATDSKVPTATVYLKGRASLMSVGPDDSIVVDVTPAQAGTHQVVEYRRGAETRHRIYKTNGHFILAGSNHFVLLDPYNNNVSVFRPFASEALHSIIIDGPFGGTVLGDDCFVAASDGLHILSLRSGNERLFVPLSGLNKIVADPWKHRVIVTAGLTIIVIDLISRSRLWQQFRIPGDKVPEALSVDAEGLIYVGYTDCVSNAHIAMFRSGKLIRTLTLPERVDVTAMAVSRRNFLYVGIVPCHHAFTAPAPLQTSVLVFGTTRASALSSITDGVIYPLEIVTSH